MQLTFEYRVMKTVKILTIALIALFATACEKKCSATFCKGATAESYSPDFKVYMTGIGDHYIPLKYNVNSILKYHIFRNLRGSFSTLMEGFFSCKE